MNIVLIFAGGTGQRMGNKELPKQFMEYNGKPILIYTLENFEKHSMVDGIVLVCLDEYVDYARRLLDKFSIKKVVKIVAGGTTGQESIYNGLVAISSIADDDAVVLIHDGVRPFVTMDTISQAIECTRMKGNAIAVVPAIETVIIRAEDKVAQIMDRKYCQLAKAPQCFKMCDIWDAHQRARKEGRSDFIDSASLMMHYGHVLHTVDTTYDNIKITTPKDFHTFCSMVDGINKLKKEE